MDPLLEGVPDLLGERMEVVGAGLVQTIFSESVDGVDYLYWSNVRERVAALTSNCPSTG